MNPTPFLKWAGGKTQLLPELLKRIPSSWDREKDPYFEPFLGGGALFWELKSGRKNAYLSDTNPDLIHTYRCVRDDVDGILGVLDAMVECYAKDAESYYYKTRNDFNEWRSRYLNCPYGAAQAAAFIFLNKTCFNGLYRVNSKGEFNVPWGKYRTPNLPTAEHLRACSAALHEAVLQDWSALEGHVVVEKSSLIYCDPPYVPVSKTADFTAYTIDGFSYVDQLSLAVWAADWRRDGAHVMLSNADDKSLIEQYRRLGFRCDRVSARRSINSKAAKRGAVGEYIIW